MGGGKIVILVKDNLNTNNAVISASGEPICGQEILNEMSGGSGGYVYLQADYITTSSKELSVSTNIYA